MKKKPAVLLMLLPWLCLASAAYDYNYPQVKFSTAWVTPEKYNSFITDVRAALVSTAAGAKSNGIPVLPGEDDPVAQQTFLNITLTNKAGLSISLKMDVTGARFTAYVAGKHSCLISSAFCWAEPYSSSAVVVATPPPLESFPAAGGGGGGVGGAAATTWRPQDLDAAISSLSLFATGKATKEEMRQGVATCDMMVASAAKFPYVQRRISAGMWDGAAGGSCVSDEQRSLLMQGLQSRWPALSSAVQESFQGAFAAPVALERSNGGPPLRVDNVLRAVPLLSFLEHDKCNNKAPASSSSQRLPMAAVIRSVVDDDTPTAACSQAEPTMHIVGAEGKCVDVPYSAYVSGMQVILWPCRSNDYDDMNQLWTFKRDGTIRCSGMCLAATSAEAAGSAVVIHDCSAVPARRTVWEVRADGTIALSSTGLVLAVTSPANRAGVTLQADDRGTGQSWTPTNDTAPLVTTILGYRDLCLQVSESDTAAVLAAPCGGARAEWALYPDGSVRRPSAAPGSGCLAAADAAGRVAVSPCDLAGSSRQRWVFRNDGTVYNSGTGSVLDVRPRLGESGCVDQSVAEWEAIVSPASGSPTQNWSIML